MSPRCRSCSASRIVTSDVVLRTEDVSSWSWSSFASVSVRGAGGVSSAAGVDGAVCCWASLSGREIPPWVPLVVPLVEGRAGVEPGLPRRGVSLPSVLILNWGMGEGWDGGRLQGL
jgi:hypothetical protein